ncbi:hypothetical protein E2C01_000629 [Portunus trituberculatus]|uniref:Uncharacterized protein n=1 Tax=Portunus trituberculatus TaxID=210409 RepID=A0A5B7CFP3_PORTR|nr:hypothetical protein [Portunus trituberculatus]
MENETQLPSIRSFTVPPLETQYTEFATHCRREALGSKLDDLFRVKWSGWTTSAAASVKITSHTNSEKEGIN